MRTLDYYLTTVFNDTKKTGSHCGAMAPSFAPFSLCICAKPLKPLGHQRSSVDGLITPTLKAAGSNPVGRTILTKRYRCVWRKARRINRFRAFSGPDFFFQTIDANRCFRASAPIRTGDYLPSDRCIQPAPFFSGVFFRLAAVFFSKKNHKDLGIVLLVLTD